MSALSGSMGAVMGADATTSAANTSAEAQKYAADQNRISAKETLASQTALYEDQMAKNEPYAQMGYKALPYLMSALYGGKQSVAAPGFTNYQGQAYIGPNGQITKSIPTVNDPNYHAPAYTPPVAPPAPSYTGQAGWYDPNQLANNGQLTPDGNYTIASQQEVNDGPPQTITTTYLPSGEPVTAAQARATATPTYTAPPIPQVNAQGYTAYTGPQLYQDANGNISTQGAYEGEFKPGESPAAKWQMEQGTKQMNRQLAARGMLGGGSAINRLGEMQRGISASDYQDQYQRLLDSINVAKGFKTDSSGMNSALGQYNSSMQASNNSLANGLSSAATQLGQAQAGLWSGLGQASGNAISTGVKAYQYGQDAGLWGSAASGYATMPTTTTSAITDASWLI
jgi:hypothetical protein